MTLLHCTIVEKISVINAFAGGGQTGLGIGQTGGRDEFEQGALARAGMPGEKYHFAFGNVEDDVFQRFITAGVALVGPG